MASHNAKDPIRHEAHILRQLCSLDEWRGKLVHLALERHFIPTLKQGTLISCSDLTKQTLDLAQKQFQFSEQRKYKEAGLTKTAAGDYFLALREHEYEMPVHQADLNAVFEQIRQCYRVLYSQTKFLSFLQSGDWYSAEPFLGFKFNGATINARLDLVIGYSNTKLCIIDWKIGSSKTSDYSQQLRLYAFAALQKWPRYKVEDLLLVEANLLQGKLVKHTVDATQLLKIEDFIYRSLLNVRALTSERKYSLEHLEDYEYANSPLSCEYCNFEQLCMRLAS